MEIASSSINRSPNRSRERLSPCRIDASQARTTSYEYNAKGELVKTTFPDGTAVKEEISSDGRLVNKTNQLGQMTSYQYDLDGRLKAIIQPAVNDPDTGVLEHPRTEYSYDKYGDLTSVRDNIAQIGNTVSYDHNGVTGNDTRVNNYLYDQFKRQVSHSLPLGQTETSEYGLNARDTRTTDFLGNVTDSVFSDLGFLDHLNLYAEGKDPAIDDPDQTIAFQYNELGQVLHTENEDHETAYHYDDQGRLTQVASAEGVVNYQYDSDGHLARTFSGEDPDHPETATGYGYDDKGRLETVTLTALNGDFLETEDQQVTRYTYDAMTGLLETVTFANGVVSAYSYDIMDRVLSITHYAPDETPETLVDNPVLESLAYDYYAGGIAGRGREGDRGRIGERDRRGSGSIQSYRTAVHQKSPPRDADIVAGGEQDLDRCIQFDVIRTEPDHDRRSLHIRDEFIELSKNNLPTVSVF